MSNVYKPHANAIASGKLTEDFKRYQCPRSNRLHAAIPVAEADLQIAKGNQFLMSEGDRPTASMAVFLRCCDCGTASTEFSAASGDDGFLLATL